MKKGLLFLLLLLASIPGFGQQNSNINDFHWEELSSLPPLPGQQIQIGVAGAFSGIHNNALIIAGGANFPNEALVEGGEKVWWDNIYVLAEKNNGELYWVTDENMRLPQPMAYGVSISSKDGLICIGGNTGERELNNVFILRWDEKSKKIATETLPSLPKPMANMAGALVGKDIYVAGSDIKTGKKFFWALDTSDPISGWSTLNPWPGPPRTHAVAVGQSNGENDCFYLFGGRFKKENNPSQFLHDGYSYDPSNHTWVKLNDIKDETGKELALSAGSGIASGANHILLLGGSNGKIANQLEQLIIDISVAFDSVKKSELIAQRNQILLNHQGFTKDILAYHTITNKWTKIGELPSGSQVTTNAFYWRNNIIIPSGEISPGIRTPVISRLTLVNNPSFGAINYTVLIFYLIGLVIIGFIVSKNQKDTDDFFKAKGRIPWWAAGLSIFGTQLSAITFMAIPSRTFSANWLNFFLLMSIVMVAPFIIKYFLPFFRRLNVTTAYEYLEKRFNLAARVIGVFMYILLQIGRLGIVLLLPAIALSVVTGLNVNVCILLMGILSIIYTVLGGIEAVIWTDVMQVIVLMGGALLCLVMIVFELDLGFADSWEIIERYDKLRIFDFTLDLSSRTFWVVLLGGIAGNVIMYGSDQTVIQRYLTTKDEKTAAKSIWAGALMTFPSAFIFFSIGTALFLFYSEFPQALNVSIEDADAIFPWYIASQLPQGVSGILIAAIFAAAMSSLDSSMNSVATVVTTDIIRRFSSQKTEKTYLKMARLIILVVGILGISLALVMATWGVSSLWDEFNTVVGLFAGGLGGIFVLGIFSKKANGPGAVTGIVASGIIQFFVNQYTTIHFLMYSLTGILSALAIGYLASLLFAGKSKNIYGLTIYTLSKASFPSLNNKNGIGDEEDVESKEYYEKAN